MAYRNIPPEAIAAILGLKGLCWLVVGWSKLQAARSKPGSLASPLGMISSVRADGDVYIATVEYKSQSGDEKHVMWSCDTEPSLGQSVLLRPSGDGPDQMEIAESGDSVRGALFCLAIGCACFAAACAFVIS